MIATIAKDLPGLGLAKGQEVRIVATHKSIGRVTIKTESGENHTLDSYQVEIGLKEGNGKNTND